MFIECNPELVGELTKYSCDLNDTILVCVFLFAGLVALYIGVKIWK